MFVNLNGKIINEIQATVSVNNRSFRYGDGCFETMKFCNNNLLLSAFHFERLFASLAILQFMCPSYFNATYLLHQVEELVSKNQHNKLARIRLTIFRGNGGLYDPENMFPNWLIQSWPVSEVVNSLNINGVVTGIFRNGIKAADQFANLKSNNYLLYSQAALYAKKQHWNDALVLNHRQTLSDATIANLFLIKGNTIITPPLSDGPVSGVMRRFLLEGLPAINFQVMEQTIHPGDLHWADEAFLTNAMGLKWIQSIDDHQYRLNKLTGIHKQLLLPLYHA